MVAWKRLSEGAVRSDDGIDVTQRESNSAGGGARAPLRAAIVGYGYMGEIRRRNVESHPDLVLAGICDPKLTAPTVDGARVFADYQSLVGSGVDVVFVCTPNNLTPEVTVYALEQGKHVFCEKPPGRTLADIVRIRAAEVSAAGRKLIFGFNHRHHPGITDAKAIVDSGSLGGVLTLRGVYGKSGGDGYERSWRNNPSVGGGGILLDQGIHMLDLFRFFCGDFDEVTGMAVTSHWDVPVEDNAVVLLRNRKGQMAQLHSTATAWKHIFRLEIGLESGYLAINGLLSKTGSYGRETLLIGRRPQRGETAAVGNPREELSYYDRDPSWDLEVNHFVECVRENRPVSLGTSLDALRVMEIVDRVYREPANEPFRRQQALSDPPAPAAFVPAASDDRTPSGRKTVVSLQELVNIDIRPGPLVERFQELTRASVAALTSGPLVDVTCQACASPDSRMAFEKLGLSYRHCDDCGSLFASPRPAPAALAEYYRSSPAAVFWRDRLLEETRDARRAKLARPRAEWVVDGLAEHRAHAIDGLDLSSQGSGLSEELRVLAPGLQVQAAEPIAGGAFGAAASADFVLAFDALDRMPDLRAFVAAVRDALRPGGVLFVTAPSISGFDLQALWDRSPTIVPPDKMNLLSIAGFSRLFDSASWEIIELSTPGMFDVENVRQAIAADPEGGWPRAIRELVTTSDDARSEFQQCLQRSRLASFARLVVRRR